MERPKRATLKRLLTDRSFCGSQDFSKKLVKKARLEEPKPEIIPNLVQLTQVFLRPGKKQKGSFELKEVKREDGTVDLRFQFVAELDLLLDLDSTDITHCMFYRNQGDAFTVIQFLTATPFVLGLKSYRVFQIIHEGGRKTRNPREINLIFKSFVHSFKDRVTFPIDIKPHRKLGFMSTVFDELVKAPTNLFLQATKHCVVGISLENQPEFYIFLKDVVAVFLERVKGVQSFDMIFVTRSASALVTTRHVTQIPKKGFEYVKEWLGTTGLPFFETANSMSWEFNLAEIRATNQTLETIQWTKLLEPKKDQQQKKEVAELLENLADQKATKKEEFAKPLLASTKTKVIEMDVESSDSSFCCDELGSFEEGSDSQEELDSDASDLDEASDATAILSSLGSV